MKIDAGILLSLILTFSVPELAAQGMYHVTKGKVHFSSDAPQENIQATSESLKGLLNTDDNSYAFTIEIQTFEGFNSALQREHFNENYMESDKYPKAVYTGKLIDKFNPASDSQKLRSKGQLEIHGIKKERIIDVVITRKGEVYHVSSSFNVLLVDHGISVPKIVFQKIAETIKVDVTGELSRK